MQTPPRGAELKQAIDLERLAYEQRQQAFVRLNELFLVHADGPAIQKALHEAKAADEAWKAAVAELKRLSREALVGKP